MSEKVETIPGVMVGGMRIVRQVHLVPGGDALSFDVALDSTAHQDDILELLDRIDAAVSQEKAKIAEHDRRADLLKQIAEKKKALSIELSQPFALRKDIERLRQNRAIQEASYQAAHSVSNKRADWRPNATQQQALDQFEAQIKAAELSIVQAQRDVPMTKWTLACLEARLNGEPEPEPPAIAGEILHDLAAD